MITMTLLLVVASLYVTTALFDIRGTQDQERIYKTKRQMGYLRNAIVDFRSNNKTTALTTLSTLVTDTGTACQLTYVDTFLNTQVPNGWCGPYLDSSLFLGSTTAYQKDAWGTDFQLSSSGTSGDYTYTLTSCGENQTCGNADDIPLSF